MSPAPRSIPSPSDTALPRILELETETGCLLYVGVIHSFDPGDPQFSTIERCWDRFRPDVALSEGNLRPPECTRDSAVRLYGEQGLLRWLASRDGIPVRSFDPSLIEQARFLKRSYSAESVALYFILREAAVRRRLGLDFRLEVEAAGLLDRLRRIPTFRSLPRNPEDLKAGFRRIFPWVGDWTDIPAFFFYRVEEGGILARIHSRLNRYRDRIMSVRITRELERGGRVFAVAGRRHLIEQEPVLRAAVFSEPAAGDIRKSIPKKVR